MAVLRVGLGQCLSLLLACGGGEMVASDAAAPPDSSSPDAAPPLPPPRQTADRLVFVQRSGLINAQFRPDDEGPGSCRLEWVHGCEVQDCDYSAEPGGSHAGEITIEASSGSVVLTPPAYEAQAVLSWAAGEPVTITAAGGDVPAFRADLRGPAPLEVTEPALSGTLAVARDQPLPFKWEGGSEQANFGVRCSAAAGRVVLARCPVEAEAGEGAVPVEVLELIPDCESAIVFVMSEHRVELESGGLFVRVGARGSLAHADVVIE